MGERCNRTAEVWGSIPHSSTKYSLDFVRFPVSERSGGFSVVCGRGTRVFGLSGAVPETTRRLSGACLSADFSAFRDALKFAFVRPVRQNRDRFAGAGKSAQLAHAAINLGETVTPPERLTRRHLRIESAPVDMRRSQPADSIRAAEADIAALSEILICACFRRVVSNRPRQTQRPPLIGESRR